MKKYLRSILCLMLALCMVVCFAACSDKADEGEDEEKEEKTTQKADKETEGTEDEGTTPVTPAPTVPVVPSTPSIAGKYLLVEMTQDGITMNRDVLVQAFQVQGMDLDSIFYLILEEDGSAEFCIQGNVSEMKLENGMIWPVDSPDEKIPYTLENGKLSFTLEGTSMTLQTGPIDSAPTEAPADTNIVGAYTLYSMNDGTNTYTGDILDLAASTQGFNDIDDLMSLELKADGTGTMTALGQQVEIVWDSTTIRNPDNASNAFTYTFDAGYLTFSQENYTYVFMRK